MGRLALVLLAFWLGMGSAMAHGGGLDDQGCHHNRKQGGYHCHRGPLAGQAFANRRAAGAALAWLSVLDGDSVVLPEGQAWRVVDGDTLETPGGNRVRIQGIDTPELDQQCRNDSGEYACGLVARQAMRRLVEGAGVRCAALGFDVYGRVLGICHDAAGRDIGAELVKTGMAMAYRRFSDRYLAQEAHARAAKIGIWSGPFTPPWEWRQQR